MYEKKIVINRVIYMDHNKKSLNVQSVTRLKPIFTDIFIKTFESI